MSIGAQRLPESYSETPAAGSRATEGILGVFPGRAARRSVPLTIEAGSNCALAAHSMPASLSLPASAFAAGSRAQRENAIMRQTLSGSRTVSAYCGGGTLHAQPSVHNSRNLAERGVLTKLRPSFDQAPNDARPRRLELRARPMPPMASNEPCVDAPRRRSLAAETTCVRDQPVIPRSVPHMRLTCHSSARCTRLTRHSSVSAVYAIHT